MKGRFPFNYHKHLHRYILYIPSSFSQQTCNVAFSIGKIITDTGVGSAVVFFKQIIIWQDGRTHLSFSELSQLIGKRISLNRNGNGSQRCSEQSNKKS